MTASNISHVVCACGWCLLCGACGLIQSILGIFCQHAAVIYKYHFRMWSRFSISHCLFRKLDTVMQFPCLSFAELKALCISYEYFKIYHKGVKSTSCTLCLRLFTWVKNNSGYTRIVYVSSDSLGTNDTIWPPQIRDKRILESLWKLKSEVRNSKSYIL